MRDSRLLPSECRVRQLTYTAPLIAEVARQLDGSIVERFEVNFGAVPIMVKSKFCHLSAMTSAELVKAGEDVHEPGGYFIVNGIERLIRLLIVNKRNYPIALSRPAFCNRGPLFTPLAIQVRCVRDDLFAQTVTVHYLSDGSASVRFLIRRAEFLIPAIVLLKCLKPFTDYELYSRLVKGNSEDQLTSNTNRVEVLIKDARRFSVFSQEQALAFVGNKFRVTLNIPAYLTDKQAGEQLIKEHLFVQVDDFSDKFFFLTFLIEKLYALAAGDILPENLDALCCQDLLLPGQLYLNLIKERIEDNFEIFKARVLKEREPVKLRDKDYVARILEQVSNIGSKLQNFLATGNITSKTGLDLSQTSGFTVVAEKINYARYISHFQSVHRGQYFTEMKITTVRKLLPESWGFMCPVHTPDGSPCGLLNHLSSSCRVVGEEVPFEAKKFVKECVEYGLEPLSGSDFSLIYGAQHIAVLLNGRVVGYTADALRLVAGLRLLKAEDSLPEIAEIACFLEKPLFPAVYIFTSFGRLVRPVRNLASGATEYVGPLEQTNLSIAVQDVDIRSDTTHQELSPLNMLSILAVMTPFSDYNQSPRNMYQCQMAKQTMGTPLYNYRHRSDTKTYRLLTPQRPLVNSEVADMAHYGFESYPSGTNAVVAVISYTGYDMEDAMILNKSAYERGFAHGCVYKSMTKKFNEKEHQHSFIDKSYTSKAQTTGLDADGLACVGQEFTNGSAELMMQDVVREDTKTFTYKDSESAFVDEVRVFSADRSGQELNVHYTYRHPRNPIIGDKFSSRHGQKGVLSILWPTEDMPFTESGMTPDIIINPHAFPTRMTIGMLVESMAGKSGAVLGSFQESTPFQQYYNDSIVEYFGEELQKAGYNYFGNELMHSGIFGTPFKADIFIGVVYYQRLRHMVADKFQARSTGPIDVLTHQPVKGRKHHGGIRLGEMERDSLLAHGTAFLLYDRLMKCSDYSEGFVCPTCSSLLTVIRRREDVKGLCTVCGSAGTKAAVPYVLRYLSNELAAMNIRLKFSVKV
jgi:DNA-directed RNA polymerase I subunit RPA2